MVEFACFVKFVFEFLCLASSALACAAQVSEDIKYADSEDWIPWRPRCAGTASWAPSQLSCKGGLAVELWQLVAVRCCGN